MPVIGITTAHDARPIAYLKRIWEAGGAPLVLRLGRDPATLLPHLDGLLLTGGADVQPALYGVTVDTEAGVETDLPLDDLEMGLLARALEEDLPVLAICRGFQLLNVACGGTLIQDIHPLMGRHRGAGDESVYHPVDILPRSLLAEVLGLEGRVRVNSIHHQGLAGEHLAQALRASACAPDGLVEGVESPEHRWVAGVQCHPELKAEVPGEFQRLFRGVVSAALAFRATPAATEA